MKIIGLCGGSGSGKGLTSNYFRELGIPSIDTDQVYHDLICVPSPCVDELSKTFGSSIVDNNGAVNRKALSNIVFGDNSKARLKILNEITHRHILDKTRQLIKDYASCGVEAVIVDAPLLFESGFDKECDVTVAIIADRKVRIQRIVSRDGISENDAIIRIDAQTSNEELIKRCNYFIENNGDVDSLRESVAVIYKKIMDN